MVRTTGSVRATAPRRRVSGNQWLLASANTSGPDAGEDITEVTRLQDLRAEPQWSHGRLLRTAMARLGTTHTTRPLTPRSAPAPPSRLSLPLADRPHAPGSRRIVATSGQSQRSPNGSVDWPRRAQHPKTATLRSSFQAGYPCDRAIRSGPHRPKADNCPTRSKQ